jgi:hypothetical protein
MTTTTFKIPRVFKLARTVSQQPDGRWFIPEWERFFKSVTGAQRAINREAANVVKHNPDVTVVQEITWKRQ